MTSDAPSAAADGPELFRSFLEKHRISQRRASRELGVSDPTINDWIHRKKRPKSDHRDAIATWTNGDVPARAWLTAEESAKMREVKPFTPDGDDGDGDAVTSSPKSTGTEG